MTKNHPHELVPLEDYAAIGACLRFFPRGRRADVLERIGLSASAWEAIRVAWTAAIEGSTAQGGPLLTDWSKAFDEVSQRLRELTPTVETFDLGGLVGRRAAPEPEPEPEPEASKPRELPSYLVTSPGPVVPSKPRGELRTMTMSFPEGQPPMGAALPFVVGAPPKPASVPPPINPRMSGTLPLSGPTNSRPRTMPFQLPTAPNLTFNQYAALKAELSAFPANVDSIWVKYGVTKHPERAAVELHWSGVLSGDPQKHARFNAIYGQYLSQWAPKPR